ncbi:MAG: glycine oxidase ThiO, partial [Pyrinomonadaceae bacterium]
VIGLSVARALKLRGLREVLLIERSSLGREASFAAAGMLAPQAEADGANEFFHLACKSRDMYPAFASELYEESGIDIELEKTGTLYLAFTDHDIDEVKNRYRWQSKAALPIERLTARDALKLEPSISSNVQMALKFPLDMQVENRRLIKALAVSNERSGVRMLTETSVKSMRINRRRLNGVETSRGFVATECVVVACGAWSSLIEISNAVDTGETTSPRLLSSSPLGDILVEPVRGQMLSFATDPRITQHVIYSPRGYIVPRSDGRLLAGSTTEHVGFDKNVTDEGIQTILTAAEEISPAVASLPVTASWAGLRPRASDDLPVLGPCAEIEGVFYATGHYRNGILLAPITGELLAGAIIDREVAAIPHTFSPSRFGLVSVN